MTAPPDVVWAGGTAGCFAHARDVDGTVVLLAGTAGGVLTSRDGGHSWNHTGEESQPAFVETVIVSPRFATDGTIYAGGVEGLFASRDGGRAWARLLDAHVHATAIIDGAVLAGTDRDGVVRSSDGGRTWESANPGLLDTTALTLAVSPPAPSRVVFAGTTTGIYLSRNAGKAWRMAETPFDEIAVAGIAVSPAWNDDRTAFAATEGAGLWRTTDRGLTWTALPVSGAADVTAVASGGDATSPVIFAAMGNTVLSSRDHGETWRAVGESTGEIAALHLLDDGWLLAGQYDHGIARLPVR